MTDQYTAAPSTVIGIDGVQWRSLTPSPAEAAQGISDHFESVHHGTTWVLTGRCDPADALPPGVYIGLRSVPSRWTLHDGRPDGVRHEHATRRTAPEALSWANRMLAASRGDDPSPA